MVELVYPLINLVSNSEKYLDESISSDLLISLFKTICKIQKDEREEVIELAAPFISKRQKDYKIQMFNGNGTVHRIPEILDTINEIPVDERRGVVALAAPILRGGFSERDRKILKAIVGIPIDQREGVLELASSFVSVIQEDVSLGDIIKIIGLIPVGQREGFIENWIAFISNISDSYDRSDILSMIESIPATERVEVILAIQNLIREVPLNPNTRIESLAFRMISFLAADGIGIDERRSIVAALGTIDPLERETFFNQVERLIGHKTVENSYERSEIIQALQAIPEVEREEVVDWMATFIHYGSDLWVIAPILSELRKIPRGEITQVIELVGNHNTCLAILALLKAITDVPADEREGMIQLAHDLTRYLDDRERLPPLYEVGRIPAEERAEIINLKKSSITTVQDGYQRLAILKATYGIPAAKRERVVESAINFIKGIQDRNESTHVLWAIGGIPFGERLGVMEQAISYIDAVNDGYKRAALLRTISGIPAPQRGEVIELANVVLQGHRQDVVEVFKVISTISATQRGQVIELAIPLFNGIINGHERAAIFGAISAITATKRVRVVELAIPLFNGIINGHQMAAILNAISAIPAGNRTRIVEQVLPFINKIANGYQRARTLDLINKFPSDERALIIELAAPFISVLQDGNQIPEILYKISCIPALERLEALKLVHSMISGLESQSLGEVIIEILKVIGRIPIEEREGVIKLACPLIGGSQDPFDRPALLDEISSIPLKERVGIIELVTPLIWDIPYRFEGRAILKAVYSIPTHEREAIVRLASPFIPGITEGNQRAVVIHAFRLPVECREGFVEKITSLISSHKNICFDVLEAMSLIPVSEMVEFVDSMATLKSKISGIKHIPAQERAGVIKLASLLIRDITWSKEHTDDILRAISSIPTTDRAEVILAIKNLIGQMTFNFKNLEIGDLVLSMIEFVTKGTTSDHERRLLVEVLKAMVPLHIKRIFFKAERIIRSESIEWYHRAELIGALQAVLEGDSLKFADFIHFVDFIYSVNPMIDGVTNRSIVPPMVALSKIPIDERDFAIQECYSLPDEVRVDALLAFSVLKPIQRIHLIDLVHAMPSVYEKKLVIGVAPFIENHEQGQKELIAASLLRGDFLAQGNEGLFREVFDDENASNYFLNINQEFTRSKIEAGGGYDRFSLDEKIVLLPVLPLEPMKKVVVNASEEDKVKHLSDTKYYNVSGDEGNLTELLPTFLYERSSFEEQFREEKNYFVKENAFLNQNPLPLYPQHGAKEFLDKIPFYSLALAATDPRLQKAIIGYLRSMNQAQLSVVLPFIHFDLLVGQLRQMSFMEAAPILRAATLEQKSGYFAELREKATAPFENTYTAFHKAAVGLEEAFLYNVVDDGFKEDVHTYFRVILQPVF